MQPGPKLKGSANACGVNGTSSIEEALVKDQWKSHSFTAPGPSMGSEQPTILFIFNEEGSSEKYVATAMDNIAIKRTYTRNRPRAAI